jgi:heme/copper-type cytochrome/quinol oxidase subunit 3
MNALATVGAFVLGLGVLAFVVNALWSSRRGRQIENPWHADSLEWATLSPPPAYKFAELPAVDSRHPLWAQPQPLPIRLRDDRRAALVTTLVDANVDHTTELPGPSPWPAVAALATAAMIVACIFTPWGLPVGAALLAMPLVAWFWPRPPHKPLLQPGAGEHQQDEGEDDTDEEAKELSWGSREPLFWGLSLLIVIESGGLALLLASYFYLSGNEPSWPPPGVRGAPLWPALLGTGVLLVTALTQHRINLAARAGDLRGMRLWLVLSTAIAAVFIALRFVEFKQLPFYWDSHAYGSIVWVIIGYHTVHALTGVVENLMLIALLFRGPVERKHALDVQLSGLYWYFMVAAWLPCFASIYLGRYL